MRFECSNSSKKISTGSDTAILARKYFAGACFSRDFDRGRYKEGSKFTTALSGIVNIILTFQKSELHVLALARNTL